MRRLAAAVLVSMAGCTPVWPPLIPGFSTTTTPPPAPTTTTAPTTTPPPPEVVPTTIAGPDPAVAATLACIRSVEQGAAGYATETGNGFSGAYQFSLSTWHGAVTRAGLPEWAAQRASEAPPWVQDAAAALLFSERGLAPWPPAWGCAA